MSSALSLMVFGQVYFLGPVINNASNTPGVNVTPTVYQNHTHPELPHVIRRSDYTYIPGIGAYKVHTKAAPWHSCRRSCEEEGGYLAIINSADEARHVAQLGKNSGPGTGTEWPEYFHIGIHSFFQVDEWITVHSEPLTKAGYNEWDAGQPDRHDLKACGSINSVTAKFDDSAYTTPLAFICELPNAV